LTITLIESGLVLGEAVNEKSEPRDTALPAVGAMSLKAGGLQPLPAQRLLQALGAINTITRKTKSFCRYPILPISASYKYSPQGYSFAEYRHWLRTMIHVHPSTPRTPKNDPAFMHREHFVDFPETVLS
jgi:hypothetical protein